MIKYFMVLVAGVILGYGWCYYHQSGIKTPENAIIISFKLYDMTAPPHKKSRKYMTHPGYIFLENPAIFDENFD